MAKIPRLIWVEDYLWLEIQKLYPRQASKIIEKTFSNMINDKTEDRELLELKQQAKDCSEYILAKTEELTFINAKIQKVESQKRTQIINDNKEEKELKEQIKAFQESIDASGEVLDKEFI